MLKTICVFCGSSDRIPAPYLTAARQMGETLAHRGLRLVYGAGSTGMMGALADGALSAGGEVIGVIPEIFNTPALMHNGLTRLEIVPDMHTRKARMAQLADAFIALPGGLGTFEELFEMLTWLQIGLHTKPIGLLNTRGYFESLVKMVDHACREGFMYREHRDLFIVDDAPESLLSRLEDFRLPEDLHRWVERDGPPA
ncbi:MAG: TIGR00730 family Rossman fold protein [Anaerolineae bacterium]|nr:MAG: TIGR00730 family Rossman fold protein [Anaerolineae bacterium]